MTGTRWIQCFKPNLRADLRLFCFPYAGGSASIFRTWASSLLTTVEICAIQLPGRENRINEPFFNRLVPLVQALTEELYSSLASMPFAFFGHSMGGLICFELARNIRKQFGLVPLHLFIAGCRAPQLSRREPPIHYLPEDKFIEELRKLEGTPELILQNNELMQLLLPMLRADFAICETYNYTADQPLECPLSAFGGLQDKEVLQPDLLAWRDQTLNTFTLRMLSGNHFFLHTDQAALLQIISLLLKGNSADLPLLS